MHSRLLPRRDATLAAAVAAVVALSAVGCAPLRVAHDVISGRWLDRDIPTLAARAVVFTPFSLRRARPALYAAPTGDAVSRELEWRIRPAASGIVTPAGVFVPWHSGRVVLDARILTRRDDGSITTSRDVFALAVERPAVAHVRFGTPPLSAVHVGDTVTLAALALDPRGAPLPGAVIRYAVASRPQAPHVRDPVPEAPQARDPVQEAPQARHPVQDGGPAPALSASDEGVRFSADAPGLYTIVAASEGRASTTTILVEPAQPPAGPTTPPVLASADSATGARRAATLAAVVVTAPPPARVRVSDGDATPYVGTTLALRAWAEDSTRDEGGARRPNADVTRRARWSSSDTSIAVVDGQGLVTFRRAGRVSVRAAVAGTSGERRFDARWHPAADLALLCATGTRVVHTGERVHCHVDVWARGAIPIKDAQLLFAVLPEDGQSAAGASITSDGDVVIRTPGMWTVLVVAGDLADTALLYVDR